MFVFATADMGHVDPSLAERQRMLKKARLADSLNDQLSHRPGPLELIKKNILHTEEPIERAVKGNECSVNYLLKHEKNSIFIKQLLYSYHVYISILQRV
jgi:hypothetical protein